jgi:hypothetical protein
MKKLVNIVIACLAIGATFGGGVYWYHVEGKDLIKQIQQADHKPFFF